MIKLSVVTKSPFDILSHLPLLHCPYYYLVLLAKKVTKKKKIVLLVLGRSQEISTGMLYEIVNVLKLFGERN